MTKEQDSKYRYILHASDQFSKYSWTYPLASEKSSKVADRLEELFCQLDALAILQSDNGREFVSEEIKNLTLKWPDMKLVRGRPRHPQSQGRVE